MDGKRYNLSIDTTIRRKCYIMVFCPQGTAVLDSSVPGIEKSLTHKIGEQLTFLVSCVPRVNKYLVVANTMHLRNGSRPGKCKRSHVLAMH